MQNDIWALAFGWMLFACGVLLGVSFMALMVVGDVAAAIFGAALACIPAWGVRCMWKERPDAE